MNKLIDELIKKGMGNFIDRSRDALMLEDKIHQEAREEENEWLKKYEALGLKKEQERVVEGYISSIFSANHRYADISYMAGIRDTVGLLVSLGLVKGAELEGDDAKK